MENNKVKETLIQESKLTSKSKNPCIQNYTTVRKDRPHGQGGGLLIFIHRSVTFSKQPSSEESLYDPHMEELSIKAEIGNTKLILSNIYIPPASSCTRLGIQDRPIPEEEEWQTQSTVLTMVISTWIPPQECCCCFPSETYGRNGATSIFRSVHRTAGVVGTF